VRDVEGVGSGFGCGRDGMNEMFMNEFKKVR